MKPSRPAKTLSMTFLRRPREITVQCIVQRTQVCLIIPSTRLFRQPYYTGKGSESTKFATQPAELLKGASAGRRELPGDLVWYTQDKGLWSYEELKSRVSNWLYWDISDTTALKSRVSNWGLQVKTYRLIYATDETCERNETRGSCLKGKYPKMVRTDLERSRKVQSGPGWSRRVWKVCGLGGQILTRVTAPDAELFAIRSAITLATQQDNCERIYIFTDSIASAK